MRTRSRAVAYLSTLTIALAGAAGAADRPDRTPKSADSGVTGVRTFNIDAQPAAAALNEFARQADITLVFSYDLVSGANTKTLKGSYSITEALDRMLEGTKLSYQKLGEHAVAISDSSAVAHTANVHRMDGLPQGSVRVAQVEQGEASSDKSVEKSDTASREEPNRLDEIVVTATKRQESVQDIPVSIAVIGNQEIERRGLIGMADYLASVPGVSHVEMGAGQNFTVIRGIATDPQWDGFRTGSKTVGTYLGEVPLSGLRIGGAPDIKLVDIERIEVLRGPQGTLYGSGSLGGTVRNIPVLPDVTEFEAELKGSYSNTSGNGGDNSSLQGVLNIPLINDVLAVRAVAYRFNNSSYFRNIGTDPAFAANAALWGAGALAIDKDDVGNDEYTGGRVAALWRPSDKLNVTMTYITQDIEQKGLPEERLGAQPFVQRRLQYGEVVGGGGEFLGDETDLANLVIGYDFGRATLQSSTSWSKQTWTRNIGQDVFFGGIPSPSLREDESEGLTQEIRLTSNLDGPLQFLAGFYYEDLEHTGFQDTYFGGNPTLNPFSSSSLLIHSGVGRDLRQRAFFGELSYDIIDRLSVTVGVRHFSYDVRSNSGLSGGFFPVSTFINTDSNESDESYKLNLSYQPNDGTLIYGQWSQGFRLGQPGAPVPAASCDADNDGILDGTSIPNVGVDLQPDSVDNYELGAKFTALDRRIRINAAAFQIDWKGLPTLRPVPTCAFFTTLLVNGGEARSRGLEVESALQVAPKLLLTIGASYLQAELTESAPLLGGTGDSGDRLPGSPEYTASAAVQYDFAISGHSSFLRADYAYVGGFYNNLKELGIEAGNYNHVNLRFGTSIRHFDAELFVNNVTNADEITWVATQFPDRAYRLRPRTVGFNLGYRF